MDGIFPFNPFCFVSFLGMYDGCNKLQWNPPGKGLMFDDFGLAMFSLTDENDYQKLIDKVSFKWWAVSKEISYLFVGLGIFVFRRRV